jgi:hypothetical protein
MMVTISPSDDAAFSITRETCSKNPTRLSNSSMAWISSLRFSSRPGASIDLSFCHIAV